MKAFYNLLDPFHRDHVLSTMKNWIDDQKDDSQEIICSQIKTVRRLLITPLREWLFKQNRNNIATEACSHFIWAVEDYSKSLNLQCAEYNQLENLRNAWNEFIIMADGGWHVFSQTQKKKSKSSRGGDVIESIIKRVFVLNPDLKNKELWPHLFSALELRFEGVEEQIGNKKQPKTWRYTYLNDSGKRKPLSFKTFINRLTDIRTEKQKKSSQ
ncbi:hypothetical protein DSCO28_17540 [Desulfosarcina ovata subsp. sediminis]|uniref:Uncharacterized protein n=1 Tax=Desulfosarcina ovata subsp. sediminis TaxID=885957 RepID=A0A5K7ZG76_9BACT|nr:hypothetical protein [Desulfosarcina ovata]BBO81188.1 hypothetical protein DSCO28_17540 [Desulfosarcina ovata subsp. sediminis]